ncbi:MAG: hypothetical protein JXK07_15355 [Spirochaetes bacterium]|nr:hypothetical protein [Spirochaetota bacterium]MBN2769357.1 hypothetical protein [Spirochaetota bacterium]
MDKKVFRRTDGMVMILPIIAVCSGFAVYIFISVAKLDPKITKILWAAIALPLILPIFLQIFHTITIDDTYITKGLRRKKIKISEIIRFGEGKLKGYLDTASRSSSTRITTSHFKIIDSSGRTMRINWMGYKDKHDLYKLLVDKIGYSPETLYTDGIYGIYFIPLEKCLNCGQKNNGNLVKCAYCGRFLRPAPEYDKHLEKLLHPGKDYQPRLTKGFSFKNTTSGKIAGSILTFYALLAAAVSNLHFTDILALYIAPFPYPIHGYIAAFFSIWGFYFLLRHNPKIAITLVFLCALILGTQPCASSIIRSRLPLDPYVEEIVAILPTYHFIISGTALAVFALLHQKIPFFRIKKQ